MGCESPDSNFKALVFRDGQWWCTSGDFSFEAADIEVLLTELKRRRIDPRDWSFTYDNRCLVWRARHNDTGWWPKLAGPAVDEHLVKQHGWSVPAVRMLLEREGPSPAGVHNMLHWPQFNQDHYHER